MLSQDILRDAHNAVCAVGMLPIPLEEWMLRPQEIPMRVEGSGFLIRPNTVMTNQHVLDQVVMQAGVRAIPESQFFVSFIAPSRDRIGTIRMIRRTFSVELGEVDVALLEIRSDPAEHFDEIVPLQPAGSSTVEVSEEVFVCGYPYGNMLLEPQGRPHRFGPVVQQGYVSGVAPFAGIDTPSEILLDVRTAGGMSGSPVIRSGTGEVIGIHYEAIVDRTEITTTSFAIPLDTTRVTRWLAEFDEVLDDA